MGIPGGLIGPTLVIGALAGAILGQIGLFYSPESSAIGFYVLIGMAAMMGATLKAPLAALMALLELTSNTHIILPGMLAIVFSSIIVFELFKLDSVFLVLLRKKGLDYRNSPLSQALRQINVTAVMKNKFVELPNIIDRETAKQALADNPLWVVTEKKEQQKIILLAADLAAALNEEGKGDIDLLAIPGTRKQVTKVSINHSLEGVISQFDKNEVSAAYVTHRISQVQEKIVGIITKENIEAEYQVTHN
jgi:CIC family chloride channel protein